MGHQNSESLSKYYWLILQILFDHKFRCLCHTNHEFFSLYDILTWLVCHLHLAYDLHMTFVERIHKIAHSFCKFKEMLIMNKVLFLPRHSRGAASRSSDGKKWTWTSLQQSDFDHRRHSSWFDFGHGFIDRQLLQRRFRFRTRPGQQEDLQAVFVADYSFTRVEFRQTASTATHSQRSSGFPWIHFVKAFFISWNIYNKPHCNVI